MSMHHPSVRAVSGDSSQDGLPLGVPPPGNATPPAPSAHLHQYRRTAPPFLQGAERAARRVSLYMSALAGTHPCPWPGFRGISGLLWGVMTSSADVKYEKTNGGDAMCRFVKKPFPECYCFDITSRKIPHIVDFCIDDSASCPIYRQKTHGKVA